MREGTFENPSARGRSNIEALATGRRAHPHRRTTSRAPLVALALAFATLAFGALALGLPFDGDQALFALGAREMLGGAVLYVDFWDLKQPAIYWFFAAARLCFGAGPVGAHALEALWNVALALAVAVAVRRALPHRAAWIVAPLLAVAYAALVRGANGITQVEALVALPTFVALQAFVAALEDRGRRRALLACAGACAATVALFKLVLVVAVVGMWACAYGAHAAPRERRDVVACGAAIVLGFTLTFGLALAWFAAHGALGAALATWFVVPPQIVRELPHQNVAILREGFVDYVRLRAPLVALAVPGAAFALRERRALFVGALGWLVLGTAAILVQVASWWAYQWEFLDVPLALLATLGAIRGTEVVRRGPARVALVAALAFVLVGYPISRAHARLALLARDGYGVDAAQRDELAEVLAPASARARRAARAIGRIGADDLYAFGNASIYDALGAREPIAINGYSPELLVAAQRASLLRDVRRIRPRLVYVPDDARADVARLFARAPGIATFLGRSYAVRRLRDGTLYERRSPEISLR